MIWFQDVLNMIFGENVIVFNSLGDLLSAGALALFGGLKIFYERKYQKQLVIESVVSDAITKLTKKVDTEDTEMKQALGYMANMFVAAFISSPNIMPEAKAQITYSAKMLSKIDGIELDAVAIRLLDKVAAAAPVLTTVIAENKDAIVAEANKIEEEIDKINAQVQEVISKFDTPIEP
jgi:hypothetical protein